MVVRQEDNLLLPLRKLGGALRHQAVPRLEEVQASLRTDLWLGVVEKDAAHVAAHYAVRATEPRDRGKAYRVGAVGETFAGR